MPCCIFSYCTCINLSCPYFLNFPLCTLCSVDVHPQQMIYKGLVKTCMSTLENMAFSMCFDPFFKCKQPFEKVGQEWRFSQTLFQCWCIDRVCLAMSECASNIAATFNTQTQSQYQCCHPLRTRPLSDLDGGQLWKQSCFANFVFKFNSIQEKVQFEISPHYVLTPSLNLLWLVYQKH